MRGVAAEAAAQLVGVVAAVAAVFNHGVLAQGEQVHGFEAAHLDVHAGVAKLHPHVVGGGVAVFLQQQGSTTLHEGIAVGGFGADIDLNAATHRQVALAGVGGGRIDRVGVGGVEFEVGVEADFSVGGSGGGTEGGQGSQFENMRHVLLRGDLWLKALFRRRRI